MFIKTLKVRVKDKHASQLNCMAKSVNLVWNYINDLSYRSITEKGRFLSNYEVQKYTNGSNKELDLHSQSIQQISAEYTTRRKQFNKAKLAWRVSRGAKKSLGWIPIGSGASSWKNDKVYHNGNYFCVWDSYNLGNYTFRSASFNEDSRGRWYFNVTVEVSVQETTEENKIAVGLDLGLKDIATCSDGTKLESGRFYRSLENKIASAQRSKKKCRVRALHAKVANRRKDALHKFSRKLVNKSSEIYVGDVSSIKLIKTKMAKSVLDVSWSKLKTMLEYKCNHAGIIFKIVNESYTTQTCSCCGSRDSSPKGRSGLGIREWTCMGCGTIHDRDINAAKNILAVGHYRLAGGISC